MIRKAIQSDFQGIVRVLRAFRQDPVTPDYLKCDDEETKSAELFILRCLPHTFVAVEDSEVVGIILSHITAMPLLPQYPLCEELCWYVLDGHRNGTIGFRLFKAWKEYALSLKEQEKVKAVLMHTMAGSPVDMRRHRCAPFQSTFEVNE